MNTVIKVFFTACIFILANPLRAFEREQTPALPRALVPNALTIYDKTSDLVTRNFYDQTFRGLPWAKLVATHRQKLTGAIAEETLVETINELLAELHSSHTKFLSDADQEYWGLQSIFSGHIDGAPVRQIGAWYVEVQGHWFIRNVWDGSPAAKGGLVSGDEVISVNGEPFAPVRSFTDAPGESVRVAYRRSPNGPECVTEVAVESKSIQRLMLTATLVSKRTFTVRGKRIGYFHLWTGTNRDFQATLIQAAAEFSDTTDAMILDLRDGFGGSGPAYLNPFMDNDDPNRSNSPVYSKPMVALINEGTRSGKEWVAEILKRKKRALLIGSRTAGYFRAGRPFQIIPGHYLLYLAVQPDGPSPVASKPGTQRAGPDLPDLEGKGVTPDICVSFDLPFSAGQDPQLEEAILKLADG